MWHFLLEVAALIYISLIYLLIGQKKNPLHPFNLSGQRGKQRTWCSLPSKQLLRLPSFLSSLRSPVLRLALSRVYVFCLCHRVVKVKKELAGCSNQNRAEIDRWPKWSNTPPSKASSLFNCMLRPWPQMFAPAEVSSVWGSWPLTCKTYKKLFLLLQDNDSDFQNLWLKC